MPNNLILLRTACWLAIGILQGSIAVLWETSFAAKHEGLVWQPETLIYICVFFFIGRIGLIAGVMMRAHSDRRNNIMKWWVVYVSVSMLARGGRCSPYPLIPAVASVALVLCATVGLYVVAMKLDRDAEQHEVQNGYKLAVGLFAFAALNFNLYITRLSFLSPYAISGALMLYQKVCLKILIPGLKKMLREG